MREILILVAWTFVPAFELRFSIPFGIEYYKMPWPKVFAICVIANIVLGFVFYFILEYCVALLRKMAWFDRLYLRLILRPRRKIQAAVDKWGEFGVAIFIGIPLPGSGVISGAIGSQAIGLKRKKFYVANIIGVLIAAVLVTVGTLIGGPLIRRIFLK